MRLQRFLSALLGLLSMFRGTPSAQPEQADYLDFVLKVETLP
jgi:hypothetical protein